LTDSDTPQNGRDRNAKESGIDSRIQNEFLSTISHELRTPLTALAGYGEILADGILGELTPSQRDTIERMRAVTHQLTVMIDSILTFTNLQAGSEKPVLSDLDPEKVLREAVGVMEPIARKKGVELVVTATCSGVFRSDKEKIRQILVHLTDNAIKFIGNGERRVELSVADRERTVCFTVVDFGIGISEGDLQRLFQPFVRVDTGLTRRHGGIGLGLYISQCLAKLLDGRIEVESTLGVGSTFSLVLPRKEFGS
jgi:two-component system cell cycle sensor histidine kinase PleC